QGSPMLVASRLPGGPLVAIAQILVAPQADVPEGLDARPGVGRVDPELRGLAAVQGLPVRVVPVAIEDLLDGLLPGVAEGQVGGRAAGVHPGELHVDLLHARAAVEEAEGAGPDGAEVVLRVELGVTEADGAAPRPV